MKRKLTYEELWSIAFIDKETGMFNMNYFDTFIRRKKDFRDVDVIFYRSDGKLKKIISDQCTVRLSKDVAMIICDSECVRAVCYELKNFKESKITYGIVHKYYVDVWSKIIDGILK